MHPKYDFSSLSEVMTLVYQLGCYCSCFACLSRLESGTKDKLTRQLEADCFLLERMRIMDYSLLLGVHVRSASEGVNDDDAANACTW